MTKKGREVTEKQLKDQLGILSKNPIRFTQPFKAENKSMHSE